MVEELKEASDIKKLIGKNKGDEDPLLVAQRFLNIFRQLHIFDQQRREEFNSMILALPPEIRGSFGNLPGGSLLQEYVDELEISRGMQRSSTTTPQIKPAAPSSSESKESPLARAKNANQAGTTTQVLSGEAKIVADANFAQVLSQSVSSALMAANASQNSNLDQILQKLQVSNNGGKIVPDEKFATSMARAFSQALQFSDANKKADIQELIKAVRESRKIELPEGFSIANATTGAAQIANESSLAKNIADTIAKVIKPSTISQIPSSEADIKELIKAVRENKGVDVEALAKAMVSGLKPLLDNVGSKTSSQTQQLKITADADFSEIITNALTKTFEISEKKHQEQTEKLIAGFQDVMRNEKTSAKTNNPKANNEKGSQQSNLQPQILPTQLVTPAVVDNSEKFEKITQEFTKTLRSLNDSRKSENREIAQAIKDTQKELLKLLTLQNNNETDVESKKSNPQLLSGESINEIITKVAQAQADIFQELSRQQTSALSTIISLALKESQKSSVDTIVDTFKKFQEHNIQLNLPIYQSWQSDVNRSQPDNAFSNVLDDGSNSDNDTSSSSKSYIQKSIEAAKQKHESETKEEVSQKPSSPRDMKQNVAEYIKSEFEPMPLDEKTKLSSTDWGFDDSTSTPNNDFSDDVYNQPTETSSVNEQDWEWEYEEDASDATNSDEQSWEWEYEEDNNSQEPQGLEGQDWEWEYEEDDNSRDEQGLEGQDWEWEYEEDDDDVSSDVSAMAEDTTSSPDENILSPEDDVTNSDLTLADDQILENDATASIKDASEDKTVNMVEEQNEKNEEALNNSEEKNNESNDKNSELKPQVLSSADLLASIQKTTPQSDLITKTEIGIVELRNLENNPDPYMMNNISV